MASRRFPSTTVYTVLPRFSRTTNRASAARGIKPFVREGAPEFEKVVFKREVAKEFRLCALAGAEVAWESRVVLV